MDDFQGIVFSADGSWTSDYKLGLLQVVGGDPLKEASWRKRQAPLLISDPSIGGPFGPGHASFIHSPYKDGRIYCIYHGTEKADEGWNNRKARVINFGPENFHPQGYTVCCAMAAPAPGRVIGWQQHLGRPSGPTSDSETQHQDVKESALDRFVSKVMKKLNCF